MQIISVTRRPHQRIEEHTFSTIGKHLKEDHGAKTSSSKLINMFSISNKMTRKTAWFNPRNVIHS